MKIQNKTLHDYLVNHIVSTTNQQQAETLSEMELTVKDLKDEMLNQCCYHDRNKEIHGDDFRKWATYDTEEQSQMIKAARADAKSLVN